VSFWIYVVLKFVFQHHIHKEIFHTFSTNLHFISIQFNLNFNCWIEIGIPFNVFELNLGIWFQFNSNLIQNAYNVIQMEFDFCKINSFWSSINQLIVTNTQQCRTRIKWLYHNVLDFQIEPHGYKKKLWIYGMYLIIK
jgi:hypothetical protein